MVFYEDSNRKDEGVLGSQNKKEEKWGKKQMKNMMLSEMV